jgi:hypothetical protein
MRLSNWEARMMYMKTMDSEKATRNSPRVRSISLPRPETAVE